MKVKDFSDRGVSLSNLPTEKLVSDLLNFCSNDVLIVTVCMGTSLAVRDPGLGAQRGLR